ncbi:MAG: hypothetical protein OXH36_05075 [Bdellovibrionales bacterium]|nr:hypothetical protein [Bdellovibrionales bacterium]
MESPSQQNRIKFKTTQDWHNFIKRPNIQFNPFTLRENCYKDIEQLRNRPLLVYVTKFLEGVPPNEPRFPNFIDLPDVDGFTDLINSVKKSDAVDVLLHSPGGRPDATERLVKLLRSHFKQVDFLIPHSAYSAATMLALSGNNIILHPSATLSPIDPQINGLPARIRKNGFEKIKERISKEGPKTLPAYIPLIEKSISLELLELCEDSEKLSIALVSNWLKQYMFKGKENSDEKIKEAVKYLSNYNEHLMHSRPLSIEKLSSFGLKIEYADDTLQDLLWEAHILINGFFNITPFVKLYENTKGISWGKQFGQILLQQQPKKTPPKPQQ